MELVLGMRVIQIVQMLTLKLKLKILMKLLEKTAFQVFSTTFLKSHLNGGEHYENEIDMGV